MTSRIAQSFGRSTRHPVWVALLLSAITALAILGTKDPGFFRDLATKFSQQSPTEAPQPEPETPLARPTQQPRQPAARQQSASPLQLTGYDVALVVQSEDFFTPAGSDALRELVASLRDMPMIAKLFWLDDAPPINLFSLRQSAFPKSSATDRQFERAKEIALSNPLIRGQLLSADGQTLLLLMELDWLYVESDEQCIESIRDLGNRVAANYPDAGFSYLVAGRVPMILDVEKSRESNQSFYQYLGYGMVIVMGIILFRGLKVPAIVASAPVFGVFWTKGILNFFEFGQNPFNDIVLPVLVSMVGFTDAVHLMIETQRQRATGLSPRDAASAAIEKVGVACFLTSLTTAIGLGSLGWASHEAVREFGWSCVLGVILSFLAVTLFVPFACSLRFIGDITKSHGKGLIDRSLYRVESLVTWSLNRSKVMSFVAIALTIGLLALALQMKPDQYVSTFLPNDSEAARSLDALDKAFNGMETAEVFLRWNEAQSADSETVLQVITAIDEALQAEPLTAHPVSIKSFLDVLPGDPEATDRMSLAELLPPPLKLAFYDPDEQLAVIRFHVRDLGIATYSPVFTKLQDKFRELEASEADFRILLRGRPVNRWRDLYQVVVDLAFSLGTATVIIFAVLTIAYRSLRIGLISLVPNFFPLAFTGAFLYLTGGALEIASVCAFTVCLGIAVDDTIHFLTRYREDREHLPEEAAIRSAFTGTGVALIMTTVILVIGISTVIFSGMREQKIFATITCLTIGSALLGDLIFLPPLLSYFRGRDSDGDAANSPQ